VLTKTGTANLLKKVHKTLTLPNGTILPKGTTFEVAIPPANLRYPKLNQPAEWIGLRYHDLREEGGFSDKLRREYEWGAATRDDMSFGYGSHVCPGKAQGCDMLKMFLVKLLKAYELKLEDGASERYGSVEIGQYVNAPLTSIWLPGQSMDTLC
jgi:cytochrome P450